MVFLDKNWEEFGTRQELCHEIEAVTKIDTSLLLGESRLYQFSVAKRMSWAAVRQTTRSEDRAYSLMGIFNVNMPLLYGEGDNAFLRLQGEIMKNSNDESLFAWESDDVSRKNLCGLLARSPNEFANSGHIFPVSVSQDALPFSATNRGIQLQSPLLPPREKVATLVLQCSAGAGLIGIGVISKPGATNGEEDFVRRKGTLERDIPYDMLLASVLDTVYIPKSFVGAAPDEKKDIFGLDEIDDAASESDQKDHPASESDSKKPSDAFPYRIQPRSHHKKIVICFDDTTNEFTGDESDSLIFKIHRMFERGENDQVCFYRSWDSKTSLKDLVMSAYVFLMEHFGRSDTISMFGYSRGGYAARYLTALLDYVGILVNGHEHLIPKVWEVVRDMTSSPAETEEEMHLLRRKFQKLKGFRETFSRPMGRINFIGLLDAVDIPSVKNRSKGTMGLSSKIMRHAISVDERQIKLPPLLIKKRSDTHAHPRTPRTHKLAHPRRPRREDDDDDECDLQEIWFPGCHKDIGCETKLGRREEWAINHLPLVWIVTEARKAGLRFDLRKIQQFQCSNIYVQVDALNDDSSSDADDRSDTHQGGTYDLIDTSSRDFYHALHSATTKGVIHDELAFGKGWSFSTVCKNRLKNFVASKGSKISGKDSYRHIPPGARIHASVLLRLRVDPMHYKPLNLRISEDSAVVNKVDPVAECIIQGDE